jgi:hypothetical protein
LWGACAAYVPFHPLSRRKPGLVLPALNVLVVVVVAGVVVRLMSSAGTTVSFQPLSFACAGAKPPTTTVLTIRRPANHLATLRFSFID